MTNGFSISVIWHTYYNSSRNHPDPCQRIHKKDLGATTLSMRIPVHLVACLHLKGHNGVTAIFLFGDDFPARLCLWRLSWRSVGSAGCRCRPGFGYVEQNFLISLEASKILGDEDVAECGTSYYNWERKWGLVVSGAIRKQSRIRLNDLKHISVGCMTL